MDDTKVVQHVLSNRHDYYKALMITRTATEKDIKIAYKKMALKCHPDKNKHPNANEAFKVVGSAHTTLCDPAKRRVYDRHGDEGVQRHESGAAPRSYQGFNGNPYARQQQRQQDFFEELFGMRRDGAHVFQADVNVNMLMALPFIIFLILALVLQSTFTDMDVGSHYDARRGHHSSRTRHNAGFSLTPSPQEGYVVERKTSLFGVGIPYYVTRQWNDMAVRGTEDVRQMEHRVLYQYRDSLGRRCEAESQRYRARGLKEAPPICSDYDHIRSRVKG